MRHNDAEEPEDVLAPYKAMMEEMKIEGTCSYTYLDGAEKVVDGVLRAIDAAEADCIVMGVSGRDGKALGSVATGVVLHSGVTTVIVKDPHVL